VALAGAVGVVVVVVVVVVVDPPPFVDVTLDLPLLRSVAAVSLPERLQADNDNAMSSIKQPLECAFRNIVSIKPRPNSEKVAETLVRTWLRVEVASEQYR
jgi:hypothetical protein